MTDLETISLAVAELVKPIEGRQSEHKEAMVAEITHYISKYSPENIHLFKIYLGNLLLFNDVDIANIAAGEIEKKIQEVPVKAKRKSKKDSESA